MEEAFLYMQTFSQGQLLTCGNTIYTDGNDTDSTVRNVFLLFNRLNQTLSPYNFYYAMDGSYNTWLGAYKHIFCVQEMPESYSWFKISTPSYCLPC